MSIIKLKDCELTEIDYDDSREPGCHTCGCGGRAIRELFLYFDNDKQINIYNSCTLHSFRDSGDSCLLTERDVISVFSGDTDFSEMTFESFAQWFVNEVDKIRVHDYDRNVSVCYSIVIPITPQE